VHGSFRKYLGDGDSPRFSRWRSANRRLHNHFLPSKPRRCSRLSKPWTLLSRIIRPYVLPGKVRAAEAGVGLARTNYLPRADMVWQANRATDNNITGLLLPQSIIAPISGPVPVSTSNQSAWEARRGCCFPGTSRFRISRAKVDAARAAQSRVAAEASLTRLDVSIATVNAYMTLLAAEQTVRAAEADMQRRQEFSKSVHVLVDNQLRLAQTLREPMPTWHERESIWQERGNKSQSAAPFSPNSGYRDSRVEIQEGGLLGGCPVHRQRPLPFQQIPQRRRSKHASKKRISGAYSGSLLLSKVLFAVLSLRTRKRFGSAGKFLGGSEGLAPTGPTGPRELW